MIEYREVIVKEIACFRCDRCKVEFLQDQLIEWNHYERGGSSGILTSHKPALKRYC